MSRDAAKAPRELLLPCAALVLVALAWAGGQATASAVRSWLVAGALPLVLVAWRTEPLPRIALPWLALVALCLASAALSPWPGAALHQALVYWSLACGLVAGWRAASAPDRLVLFAGATTLAGTAAALPALWPEAAPGATFGNPDLLAGFLAVSLVWTAAGLLVQDARGRIAFALAALIQLAALARQDSLAAWVALGAAALCALVLALAGRARPWTALAAGALGITALALLARGPVVAEHLESRAFIFRIVLGATCSAPLLGHGAGSFPRTWMAAQAEWFADQGHAAQRALWTQAHHAHNELLHAALELGAVGALLLALPVLVLFVCAWRSRAQLAAQPGVRAALAALVAGLALCSVSLPLHEPATALLLALSLGIAARALVAGALERGWRAAGAVGLTAALVMAALASADLVADRLLARGVESGSSHQLELAATLSLRPARALGHHAALIERSDPAQAAQLADEAVRREPSPQAWVRVGRVAWARDDFEAATEAFEASVRLHPWYFTGWFNLALAWEARGDRITARGHALRARALQPTDPRLELLPD